MLWKLYLRPEDDKDKKGYEVMNCFECPLGGGTYHIYTMNIEYKKNEELVTGHFGYFIDLSKKN